MVCVVCAQLEGSRGVEDDLAALKLCVWGGGEGCGRVAGCGVFGVLWERGGS